MKFAALFAASAALVLTGCASVELAPPAESAKAKQFAAPSEGNAGIYIYRNSMVGKALKKDLWVDGKCVGESAPDVFFYTEVAGGKVHAVETESEFSPNKLEMMFEPGSTYFIRQFIKMGVLSGGADLEQVPAAQGKADIADLSLAQSGNCSSAH